MKNIAFILLFIFALVQVGPVAQQLCVDSIALFAADEEKGADSKSDVKPDKKDYALVHGTTGQDAEKSRHVFHGAVGIFPPPCLEKPTPPPNHC